MNPNIHTLGNGATVLVMSPGHGFRFSDGTECGPQLEEVSKLLNLKRSFSKVGAIKGMEVNRMQMLLSPEQVASLTGLCELADIVLVPFPVLAAMREQGIRDKFPNVLCFNATEATQRAALDQKVIDVNNWSY